MTTKEASFEAQLYYLGENGKPVVEGHHYLTASDMIMARSRAREWAAAEKAVLYKATNMRLFAEDGTIVWDKPLAGVF